MKSVTNKAQGGAIMSSNITAAQSLARVMREQREISKEKNAFWCAYPLQDDDPYEWHFTIKGPINSEFEGGLYHGKILLPQNYPFAPPSVILLTQNGRFEVGKKVCLSASNYHPELWQPTWGLRTILDALHAFFPTPGEGALHSLDWPSELRRKIAIESVLWTCPICKISNQNLVQENCLDTTEKKTPDLPEVLKNQTRRKLNNMESIENNQKENQQEDTSSSSLFDTSIKTSNTSSVCTSSSSSSSSSSLCTSTSASTSSSSCSQTPIPSHRMPPDRTSRSVVSQIFCLPKSRLELVVFILDILMTILILIVFFLLIALVVQPPNI